MKETSDDIDKSIGKKIEDDDQDIQTLGNRISANCASIIPVINDTNKRTERIENVATLIENYKTAINEYQEKLQLETKITAATTAAPVSSATTYWHYCTICAITSYTSP